MGNPNLTIMYFLGSGGLCSGNGSFALGFWDAHSLNFWCVLVEGDLVSPVTCTFDLCSAPWFRAYVVGAKIKIAAAVGLAVSGQIDM